MSRVDSFSPEIIRSVQHQSAFICSNPDCRILTVAPSIEDEMKFQYMGVVAHITAASIGGPRYDVNDQNRKKIENAIFLCCNCATVIDKNSGIDYPVETLKSWKVNHLKWVGANLNKNPFIADNPLFISNNQTGGIAGGVVNVYSPVFDEQQERRNHDKAVFERIHDVFNDKEIYKLHESMANAGECKINDLHRLDKLDVCLAKAENSFLISEIEVKKKEWGKTIPILVDFFRNFDKYPLNQNSNNFIIQLEPYLLRDNPYVNNPTMDHQKWHKIHDKVMVAMNGFYDHYNAYRLTLKRSLFI